MTLSYRDERHGTGVSIYRWNCSGAEWFTVLDRVHPWALVAWDRDIAGVVAMDCDPHVRLVYPHRDAKDRLVHGYVYWEPEAAQQFRVWKWCAMFVTFPGIGPHDEDQFAWEVQAFQGFSRPMGDVVIDVTDSLRSKIV